MVYKVVYKALTSMPSKLYLDAARMGRMAPTAQLVLQDFVRIAGEEGCTLYLERFIRDGIGVLPESFRSRFPGLHSWLGLTELKQTLRSHLGLPSQAPMLLAGRSTNLAKFAAAILSTAGPRILLTDLSWPSYRRLILREAARRQTSVDFLELRSSIRSGAITTRQVVTKVVSYFKHRRCSGLFLPEVSHDGLRLPVRQVTEAVRGVLTTARVVVDGSQAFGQYPLCLASTRCDFYVAGCHKWLGSHLPLGVGAFPNPETAPKLFCEGVQRFERGIPDDPLASFLHRLESGRGRRFTETVNLLPLFACRGALQDASLPEGGQFRQRLANARLLRRIAPMAGWTPAEPGEDFQSAAVLLRPTASAARRADPDQLRKEFDARGVALTAYDGGWVRLSMPAIPFTRDEAGRLIQALALVQGVWRRGDRAAAQFARV